MPTIQGHSAAPTDTHIQSLVETLHKTSVLVAA